MRDFLVDSFGSYMGSFNLDRVTFLGFLVVAFFFFEIIVMLVDDLTLLSAYAVVLINTKVLSLIYELSSSAFFSFSHQITFF